MARLVMWIGLTLLLATGCDTGERVSRLEKQNQELQAELKKRDVVSNYDLQAKCSKDSREWFNANWAGSRDKDTILLDFTNHYNRKDNKCFILVEYHYNSHFAGPGGDSWTNNMSVWDVYENSRYGEYSDNTYNYWKPSITSRSEVITCEVFGQKCKTVEEFNGLVRTYLND